MQKIIDKTLLILNIVVFIFFIYINFVSHSFYNIEILTNYALILLAFYLLNFILLKTKFYDFRLWFIIFSFLFMFGRLFILKFNINYPFFWMQFYNYPIELHVKTIKLILLFIHAFFTVFLFYNPKKSLYYNIESKYNDAALTYSIKKTGTTLLLISIPFRVAIDLINIINVQKTGTFLSVGSWSGIFDIIVIFFIPSLLMIISTSKKPLRILVISILYFLIIMVFTGDRRYQTTAILSLYLFYLANKNVKINFKILFRGAIYSVVLLLLLAVIRMNRQENFHGIGYLLDIKELLNILSNVVTHTLEEFGLSYYSFLSIVEYLPEKIGYLNGISFIGSTITILPVGWAFRDFFSYVSISNTVNGLTGMPLGGTIFGDIYANFGDFSIIFVVLFAFILRKLFVLPDNNLSKMKRSLSFILYFSLFYVIINIVRASYFEVFRATIYTLIIPYFILKNNLIKYNNYITNNKEVLVL